MFSIEAQFSTQDLEKMITDDMQKWFDEMAVDLMKVGKASVDKAIYKVSSGGYGKIFGNITFNLRSSMGCGIIVNNKVVDTYFPFGKGDEGRAHGLELLNRLASQVVDDIELIVVAGEFYAGFVQAKGFDVLAMSEATFNSEFLKFMNS